jgi:hypothetical protein
MRRKLFCWFGTTIIFIGLGYAGIVIWRHISYHYDDRTFDRSIWLKNVDSRDMKNPRGLMADDLVKRILKKGMTKAQVIETLGKPDGEWLHNHLASGVIPYAIGDWGGCPLCPDVIDIYIDKSGRVVRTEVTDH